MHLIASFKLGSTYSPPTFKVTLLSPTNSNVSSFWIILQVIKAPIAPTTKNITINKTVTGWFFLYVFSALLTTFLAFLLLIPVVLLILFAATFLTCLAIALSIVVDVFLLLEEVFLLVVAVDFFEVLLVVFLAPLVELVVLF